MKAVKSVRFHYRPIPETAELLQTFRSMVNDAIRICLQEDIRGRLKLRDRIYKEFQKRYGVLSCYPYSVAEVAWAIAKKHRRWLRRPFAERLTMKMDSFNYSLHYGIVSLPFKRGERLLVPLEYGDYKRSFLMNETSKRGSVTMTEGSICITFSKEMETKPPLRKIGIDLNEKSLVESDGKKIDLSEVARLP